MTRKAPLPETIRLVALGDEYAVRYVATEAQAVRVRADRDGVLLVSGPVGRTRAVVKALRRWLGRQAHNGLVPWLEELAVETGFGYARVTVRGQRTRWGSCSSTGTISLNFLLLFCPPDVVRYVLVHELCHTVHQGHGAAFWSALAGFEPDYARLRKQARHAYRTLPPWIRE